MEKPAQRPPLLVTGLPRTGTSWVGKMLEASSEVVYVNEPLNPVHPPGRSPGVLGADVTHRFQYICPENEHAWLPAFADTLALRYRVAAELRCNRSPYDLVRLVKYCSSFTAGRLRGKRPMLDDPFALLSVAWFVRRLGCQAVVLVRDPVSFVGSWQHLNWTIHFHELLDQPLLVRDLLADYAEDMRALVDSEDRVAKAALLWRIAYAVVAKLADDTPGLHVRRYEDLARDPVAAFGDLYRAVGLTWSGRVRDRLVTATTADRAAGRSHVWSLRGGASKTAFRPMNARAGLASYRYRLTQAEIERVTTLTADVAPLYY